MENTVFVAATNNGGKLKELQSVLEKQGFRVMSLEEAGIECSPEENGETFMENALIKARAVKAYTDFPVIADDSGLMAEALGGLPGVRTARYAGDDGDNERNIEKLIKELEGAENRRAWFASAVAAVMPDGSEVCSAGYTEGFIGREKRGVGGFGYDPIFCVRGNRSFAELTPERKDAVSHRGRALRKLAFKLKKITKFRGK